MCDDVTDGTECDEYSITIYHPRGKEAGNDTTAALVLKLQLAVWRHCLNEGLLIGWYYV